MRHVPSLELLKMELEQEMLLLLHVNGGSELFWKDKPLWTAKAEAAESVTLWKQRQQENDTMSGVISTFL